MALGIFFFLLSAGANYRRCCMCVHYDCHHQKRIRPTGSILIKSGQHFCVLGYVLYPQNAPNFLILIGMIGFALKACKVLFCGCSVVVPSEHTCLLGQNTPTQRPPNEKCQGCFVCLLAGLPVCINHMTRTLERKHR